MAGVAVWITSKPSLPEPDAPRMKPSAQSANGKDDTDLTNQQLVSVSKRRFQGSLKEQKKIVQAKATVSKPRPRPALNPRVELLATVIDPVRTVAIISDARGRTDLKGVGETLELMPSGLRIEKIEPNQVTLTLRGQTVKVALKGGSGAPGRVPVNTNRSSGRKNRNRKNRDRADDDIDAPRAPEMSDGPQGQPPRGRR